MEQAEVVVIGAGLLGSATARALAARGMSATLLEQFGLGHARGSSHGATRIFRLSYPDPVYVRMALTAREAWARLQAEAGEELLRTTGGLDAGPAAERCASALAGCGVAHTWLTAADMRERFPGIAARRGERVLFQPDAGVCLAARSVAALQRLAAGAGARIRPHTPVRAVEPRGDGVIVHTAAGAIAARVAVVTAGPWAASLLAGAVPRVPGLTVTRQQIRYYRPAAPASMRWPALIEWSDGGPEWYVVPAAGGAPGVKVAAHVPGQAVDPRGGSLR